MWRIARDSKVLDLNSSYSYLLLSQQFSRTCAVAEHDGQVVGFASAYRLPDEPHVLVLWQVAVDASARGQGLAKKMLKWILSQDICRDIQMFQTTVTPSNEPSTALFHALTRELNSTLKISPYFGEDLFPDAGHEAENLFHIGPFDTSVLREQS